MNDLGPVNGQRWTNIHTVVSNGEMPPPSEEQPGLAERQSLLRWIEAQALTDRDRTQGYRRRLNRREYSAALQDLIALPIDFESALPGDGLVDGFDTGASGLQDAADSVSRYLEVTRRAVDSIRFLEPEGQSRIAIDFREHEFTDFRKFVDQRWKERGIFTKSKRLTCQEGVGVYLPTQWTGDRGSSFLAFPAPKDKRATLTVRLRVSARRPMPGLPQPFLWVSIGGEYIDYVAMDETSRELIYAVRMEDHVVEDGVIKLMLRSFVETPYAVEGFENDDRSKPEDRIPGGIGVYRPRFDRKQLRTPDVQPVPAIVVEALEVDYDHVAAWPPASWELDLVEQTDDRSSAETLLSVWMERAWRRPVEPFEVARFAQLFEQLRNEGASFDESLRAAFQSVLMSGSFRFLDTPRSHAENAETRARSDLAFASRLSFMLIGAPPDQELRQLASAGTLRDDDQLDHQIDRLLQDPGSIHFFRPFVTQWLMLDQPITLVMSHFKKQDFRFGRHLKQSMKEETIQYVRQMVVDNRPAGELLVSDWTMMNDILAVHYEAPSLDGSEMRKVRWDSKRWDPRGGGIFGHAGIQSMLCWMGDNWVIYRGAWALNRVLDDPPPPPPLEVPELNPSDKEHRGKSFRELLKQHQSDPNCAVCHRTIDPIGFAFQNFDISGRWRDVEHERYHRSELDGKIEWRGEGKTRPVDATGSMPDNVSFDSFETFKTQMVQHYLDDVVRGYLKKLTLYGTGRQADVVDLKSINTIMSECEDKDYPMRDLIKSLIRSEVFQP